MNGSSDGYDERLFVRKHPFQHGQPIHVGNETSGVSTSGNVAGLQLYIQKCIFVERISPSIIIAGTCSMVRRTKEAALETRHSILDAAETVFHEKGVAKASLAEIATVAGVTRGAVYWHFANKADLFEAMIQRIFGSMEGKIAELQAQKHEDPIDFLRELVLYFIDCVANDPHYYRLVEISWHKCEYVGEMARIRDKHLECGNRFLKLYEETFQRASASSLLLPDIAPRTAAVGLMAVLDGLVANWTLDKSAFSLSKIGPQIINRYLANCCRQART